MCVSCKTRTTVLANSPLMNRFFALLAAGVAMQACATTPPTPTLTISAADWRADLEFLKRELPRKHINAFHVISREEFETAIARLETQAPNQNADERLVGLLGVVNLIGDGHTGVIFPPDRAYFPIEIQQFGDDFRVTRVAPGYERALGARVILIGETPVAQAMREAMSLTPSDENMSLRKGLALNYLTVGAALHGLDIIPGRDVALYTLQSDDGRLLRTELPTSPTRDKTGWVRPFSQIRLSDQHPDDSLWCVNVADRAAVYCDFRAYDNLAARSTAMLELISQTTPDRLVIDLRDNGGGDYTVGERKLIDPIRGLAALNRRGHLFVLIGSQTFSAAMNNAAQFRLQTAATLVGETIGEKPNSYQEPRALTLPHSKLVVRYSTRWYAFMPSGPNVVEPDVPIAPSWADYAAGRDPALDYALSHNAESNAAQ